MLGYVIPQNIREGLIRLINKFVLEIIILLLGMLLRYPAGKLKVTLSAPESLGQEDKIKRPSR